MVQSPAARPLLLPAPASEPEPPAPPAAHAIPRGSVDGLPHAPPTHETPPPTETRSPRAPPPQPAAAGRPQPGAPEPRPASPGPHAGSSPSTSPRPTRRCPSTGPDATSVPPTNHGAASHTAPTARTPASETDERPQSGHQSPDAPTRSYPKSISTGAPSSRIITFRGVMSRCRTPAA